MAAKWEKFTEEEIRQFFYESISYNEVLQKMGYAGYKSETVKKIRNKYPWFVYERKGQFTAKWRKYSFEEIHQLYSTSSTWKEFFMKMGYKESKDYSSTIKEFKKTYPEISYSHVKYRAGDKFDKLTLLEETGRTKRKLAIWKCQCDCGAIVYKSTKQLCETINSCSKCKQNQIKSTEKDILNQTFNFLLPIERVGNTSGYGISWKCKCLLCGKITKPILCSNIISGAVKSCGCLKSSGEQQLSLCLEKMGINYKQEYSFNDLLGDKNFLRFDFAIFNKKNELYCLIECNGDQHYKSIQHFGGEKRLIKTQEYDKKKQHYCQDNHIPLFIINYKDYSRITEKFIKNLIGEDNIMSLLS